METNYQDLLSITAGIVETARRNAGLTQKELANTLGVIQSTISRIEKGILSPTLFHWMEMCDILKIPQDAISVGYLDHASITRVKSDIKEGGHTLPKKYRELRCFKVRQILPLITYLRSEFGDEAYVNTLKAMGMRPTFFVNIDNQINLAFLNDLFGQIGNYQHINKKTSKSILRYTSKEDSHGVLSTLYRNAQDQIDLMDRYLKNTSKYQRAFNVEVNKVSEGELRFKAEVPEELRPMFLAIGKETEEFLWGFYLTYLKKFSLFDYKNKFADTKEIQVNSTQRNDNFTREVRLTVA